MSRFHSAIRSAGVAACICATALLPATAKHTTKAAINARAFQQKLNANEQVLHALDRLTYGPRPGDVAAIKRMGVKRWVEQQLNPEAIRESNDCTQRVSNLTTLTMTPLDVWETYPQTNMLVALLQSKPVPDDPVLRDNIERRASYFSLDQSSEEKKNANDLRALVTPQQFVTEAGLAILKSGKTEQKRSVLETIPASEQEAFLASLERPLRNQLQAAAPFQMKRAMMAWNSPQQLVAYDLQSAKIDRAVYSNRQLFEVLVDFWYNHFNVYLDKGNERFLVPAYERDAIRPHALGRFRDLLLATAQSPAMLYYLDNYQSVAPEPPKPGKTPKRGLNENYGRELLELHTLGVDGGYTQHDVVEVARCFTGWTIRDAAHGSGFWFNDKVHDHGEKTVLGVTIPAGGGIEDGLQVIEILSRHPSTARFISRKLAQRFVADNPPDSLVGRMAETFTETGGDIREVMRTMLTSREFWSKGAYRAKLKSPLEMVVSAVRAIDAEIDDPIQLANQVGTLGEPLYRKVEPTGYKNTSDEWINSAALLARMNFAMRLAQNHVPGVFVNAGNWGEPTPDPDVDDIARGLLFAQPSPETSRAIEQALDAEREKTGPKKAPPKIQPGKVAGLVIGSPDFQRR